MDIIVSLETLIEKLNQSNTSNHGKILKQINIPISEFESFASWNDECYTRNSIYRNDDYELILLCWNKGDATPIHGHDGQNCWVYQIKGAISEIRYEKFDNGDLLETNRMQLHEGNLSFMNKSMGYHKLINVSESRALTLHAYVLPIDECEYFCEDEKEFKSKELEYDSVGETI